MTSGQNSFPKDERLKRSEDFRRIVRNSRTVREGGVALYWSAKEMEDKSRFGVLVSRKALRRAVDRNRAKRIAREFFRMNKKFFSQKGDFIIRIVDGRLLESKNLNTILSELFNRAKILN